MVQPNFSLDIFATEPPDKRSHGGCGSCGSGEAASKCGNGLEKIYPTTAVRFGYMRYIGEFTHAPDMKFTCGAKVIIQTKRGIELGEQVSLTCNGCDKSVTRDQMKSWVAACGEDAFIFEAGRILREAAAADLAEYARIQAGNRQRRDFCQGVAKRNNLPMKIVECEAPFGGERLIYYFIAEERVDFRGIVKELTDEYRTRIEMRQIGARDEARLLADYETCGREVCCKVFLKTLRPISMRMAKLQKATLDPTQVSGRCGRLKCCLRYEHVSYEELDKKLPKVGVRIRTSHGEGVIVNRQILTQIVQMRTDQDVLVSVVAEDILAVNVAPKAKDPQAQAENVAGAPKATQGSARPARRRPPTAPAAGPVGSAPKEVAPPNDPDASADRNETDLDNRGNVIEKDRQKQRRRGRRRPGPGTEPRPPASSEPSPPPET